MRPSLKPVLWSAAVACCMLAWQVLTVHYNYGDNFTALFCTGGNQRIPPSLASGTWVFPDSAGFDGQFYRYIAHDPFLRHGMAEYVDAPRLRYRRILLPVMAFLFAAGQQRGIDIAYWAVTLLFIFLGAYWTSRLAESYGRSPAWALMFGLTPAALWSIDRMTVDCALLALTAAFALYIRDEEYPWRVYLTLAAAALVRETGLLLTAGYVLPLLIDRRFKRAMLFASAAVPTLAWYVYVALGTSPVPRRGVAIPFSGLLDRLLHPVPYPFSPTLTFAIRCFDYLALAGIILAIALTVRVTRRSWRAPYAVSLSLFAALCIFVWIPGDWGMAIDYTRILSPLFLLLAVDTIRSGGWLAAVPLILNIPRCLVQLAPQVPAVIKGLFGLS